MLRKIASIALFLLVAFTTNAATSVVYPDDFSSGWSQYTGQTIRFDQPLYVCGRHYSYTNTLYVSYRRLYAPEEHANGLPNDSTEYNSINAQNTEDLFTLKGNFDNTQIRLGAVLTGVTATVSGTRYLTNATYTQCDNNRPTSIPNLGGGRLMVCFANLQNFYIHADASYDGSNQTEAEISTKKLKITNAFLNIDADIFAVCEIEEATSALDTLVQRLNDRTAAGRYAYVNDAIKYTSSTYNRVAFIYRTDRVAPTSSITYPYSTLTYKYKEEICKFKETASGEEFYLSVNHFRSKNGTDTESIRMENVEKLWTAASTLISGSEKDLLIVGDLNCYTKEEPMLYLEEQGMVDELSIYSPEGYSHEYYDLVGYLDHALSSPTMHAQITGAAPYPINSDETDAYSVSAGNTSMYAYSDHDPILVAINLGVTTSLDNVDSPANSATDSANLIDALDPAQPIYNIFGIQVAPSYRGLVIQNGKKYLLQ